MPFLPKETLDVRAEIRQCPTCARRFSSNAAFCPFDGIALTTGVFDAGTDPLVGRSIDGRYVVLDVLGEGGMGRVYEVNHIGLGREFALKILRPELARDPLLAERFLREARATASVKHPNVVQITDFGRLNSVPYFVMELLVGPTLREVLGRGRMAAQDAIDIIDQVARAAGAAHTAGIIHRDLKPDNVILVGDLPKERVGHDGERARGMDVRVVDFGASKVIGASRVTQVGVVYGTPHYMSPEQANGLSADQRSDIYALGIIMYEMLTGKWPFDADTYMGVLTKHMFVEPERPSDLGVADDELGILEPLTLRCLQKRPEKRFQSMAELVAALEQVSPRSLAAFEGARLRTPPPAVVTSEYSIRQLLGENAAPEPPPPEPDAPAPVAPLSPLPRPSKRERPSANLLIAMVGGFVVAAFLWWSQSTLRAPPANPRTPSAVSTPLTVPGPRLSPLSQPSVAPPSVAAPPLSAPERTPDRESPRAVPSAARTPGPDAISTTEPAGGVGSAPPLPRPDPPVTAGATSGKPRPDNSIGPRPGPTPRAAPSLDDVGDPFAPGR